MRTEELRVLTGILSTSGNLAYHPPMQVKLAYGQSHLAVDLPDDITTVIEPIHTPGLPDEKADVLKGLEHPIRTKSLRDWISPGAKICIAFTDITRATPNDRLIPWVLEYLADNAVPRENITLLNQLGTHRPNTEAELQKMLTPEVVRDYRVINHEPENPAAMKQFGVMHDGTPALINKHLAEADVRIITGFIEPHFFAGFSGGPKGIMPGCAALETVMASHDAQNIGDPRSTFGITVGNPIWDEIRDVALRVGASFLLNVTLNEARAITGVFAGDLIEAHRTGYEFVRKSAMQKVKAPYDIVVTTNSGYPLDMNLYQGVKGMSAAARIVAEGGTIILACECREGVPAGSPLDKLLRESTSPEEMLARLMTAGHVRPEQWQAQIQALIQRRANVLVYSSLPEETLRAAHLNPCTDIAAAVQEKLKHYGPETRIAVLPQGPLTIPYLA
jgi:lactate racemase